ncbi:esterase [Janthinobacterium agaricidamnosum NBRC 102515 = DSM 9628]|uniref:Esterase n=2 Tax=Janthinobacterium agaricidamnosum TaxID=55508 RepID=W0V114_9BURK|nr:esterase [Janthinobacterium agaricidamnosum NBRC 102515 = DSM 9628]
MAAPLARAANSPAPKEKTKTFVLVHGAWYGGWCWAKVANELRSKGHQVSAPTCPGVGELNYMLSKEISLTTWIDAIVNHIRYENLSNVTLVASGFSGAVVSGVADRIPAALSKLVFLDAMVLPNGSSVFEAQPQAITQRRLAQAAKEGGGIAIPPPPASSYHIADPQTLAWVEQRLTSQPLGTYTEKLVLRNPIGNGVEKIYVNCNAAVYPPLEEVKQAIRKQPDWQWAELPAHHDPMITEPDLLVEFLHTV